MKKRTIKDIPLKGQRLLMRVDFNVPLDEHQNITDDKRIRASLPTIQYAVENGAKVILMSHLGRPKGNVDPTLSLKPAAVRLGELLGKAVQIAPDCVGPEVESLVSNLNEGDVLLLENVRFHKEETVNDPDFSRQMARLGDIYANDAFGSAHRAHSSTEGVTQFFNTCVSGFLMEKELEFLGGAVTNPKKPFVIILGGAKVTDKILIIENLLDRVDRLIIGGGMMYTFLKAQGKEIGKSLLDEDSLDLVKRLLDENQEKFVLPEDCVISNVFDFKDRRIGEIKTVSVDAIPDGWIGLDIGPRTINRFRQVCEAAKTVVWNGPMGVFELESTAKGTFSIALLLAEITEKGTTTIIGGGDSASAVKKAGVEMKVSHVSTGGGASLEFLQGKELPGVAVLSNV
ncbi:phosphoglycerate kinase [bacterium]